MEIERIILENIELFFIIYLMGYTIIMALSVLIGANTVYEKRKKIELKNIITSESSVKISILVPAYNEEITILQTISSLSKLDYKSYEIVVIDDGSTDNTVNLVKDLCKMKQVEKFIMNKIRTKDVKEVYEGFYEGIPVTLILKENGGKADSLNVGINYSNYPWFISIDADSMLQKDSLKKVIEPILQDNTVIASGGAIMLNNGVKIKDGIVEEYNLPKNIFACMQVIEYNRTFLASRIMLDKINANLIISGAFGMFRKDIVLAVDGYEATTKGEDMELVIKLHTFARINKIKYKMSYIPNAICWTQAPENLIDLLKQRKRWHIGLYECMRDYKTFFLKPECGLVGSIVYIYFFLYEFLSPYIEIFGILITILLYCLNLINLNFMIALYAVYTLLGALMTIATYFTTMYINELNFSLKNVFKVIGLCFFEIGFLRLLLSLVRFVALIGYKKDKYKWERVRRKRIQD